MQKKKMVKIMVKMLMKIKIEIKMKGTLTILKIEVL